MRIVWISDPHLDFVKKPAMEALAGELRSANGDVYLVSGDISNGSQIAAHLPVLRGMLPSSASLYFVLGNHDFYYSSFADVDAVVADFCRGAISNRKSEETLGGETRHLGQGKEWTDAGSESDDGGEVIALNDRVGLVGHRGWADGRAGSGIGSSLLINDFYMVRDLREGCWWKTERFARLNRFGDESAAYFRRVLPLALQRFPEVWVMTHVPPFVEACWHQGQISSARFLPHFTNTAAGEAIREVAARFPDRRVLVLCGHTHSSGEAQILPNLHVLTGGTTYGKPAINRVWDL
ncbi:MAG TPA: metallophosphoesterase [Candidatus Methylacidiphilales bacterium]|nr:metallophosphoesterase [Candidatus Methylacidiphilales bacterium]